MSKYIAVTIGPVVDTINLASTPCALWAGSYMLSMLSRNICRKLHKYGIMWDNIISPCLMKEVNNSFVLDMDILYRNDGVGLFHDRVIFKIDGTDFTMKKFTKVKAEAIKETTQMFGFGYKWINYFQKYFLVSAVEFESEYVQEDKKNGIKAQNPILDSSVALDCLELAKPFQKQDGKNPLLDLYTPDNDEKPEEDKKSKNDKIKRRVQNMSIQNWQLRSDVCNKNIKDLEELASGKVREELRDKFKKYKYYAVVRSDGDRMGKIISSLKDDDEVRRFSHICLEYCSNIAEKVYKEYNGISIFSGGDDLLALIPVEEKGGKTIFQFVQEANKTFIKFFESFNIKDISLSFGIFVSYYKFPLYEALEQSAYLLFGVAKKERNAVAIHFQKHSGQSAGLLIDNDSMDRFIEFYNEIYLKSELIPVQNTENQSKSENSQNTAQSDEEQSVTAQAETVAVAKTEEVQNLEEENEKKEKIFLSAMHKLMLFENMFNAKILGEETESEEEDKKKTDNRVTATDDEIRQLFKNTFDADEHKGNEFLGSILPKFFIDLRNGIQIFPITDNGVELFKDKSEKRHNKNFVATMVYILRIIKFFSESAGE